jgi:hypothetical protein
LLQWVAFAMFFVSFGTVGMLRPKMVSDDEEENSDEEQKESGSGGGTGQNDQEAKH